VVKKILTKLIFNFFDKTNGDFQEGFPFPNIKSKQNIWRCNALKKIFLLFIIITLLILAPRLGFCLEAPGNIVFERDGGIYLIQPDGRGEKKIADKGEGPVLISPDGQKVAYTLDNKIFLKDLKGLTNLVYEGAKTDNITLFSWKSELGGFMFRKLFDGGKQEFFIYNDSGGKVKSVGTLYEVPILSRTGKFWAYSTHHPGDKKSEIYCGPPGEKGQYVFEGRMNQTLNWDKENDVVMYGLNDKILGYHVETRSRQTFVLPFKDVYIVALAYPSILYCFNDTEEHSPGLKIYDPEGNEQKDIIEDKKSFIQVTHNQPQDKVVVFNPSKPGNFLGEGELFLIETKSGKSTKLTKDSGRRVLTEINMDNQWSPDGMYFIYEKVKLKNSSVKKSEIYIAGEGKDEKLLKQAAHPVWGN
jgi:hypothetical protein